MDIKSLVRHHVECQIKRIKSRSLALQRHAVSFYLLNQKDKRELAAYLLKDDPDRDDMLVNHDGAAIQDLIHAYYVKKISSAAQIVDVFLDSIVERNKIMLDEMFDEAFSEIINEQQEVIPFLPNRNFESDYDSPRNYL